MAQIRMVNDTKEDVPTRHKGTQLIDFQIFAHNFWHVTLLFVNHNLEGDIICLHCKLILQMNLT